MRACACACSYLYVHPTPNIDNSYNAIIGRIISPHITTITSNARSLDIRQQKAHFSPSHYIIYRSSDLLCLQLQLQSLSHKFIILINLHDQTTSPALKEASNNSHNFCLRAAQTDKQPHLKTCSSQNYFSLACCGQWSPLLEFISQHWPN